MTWWKTRYDAGMVCGVFRWVWLLNHPPLSFLFKQIMGGFIRWSGIWINPLSSLSISLSTTQPKSSASSYTLLLWVTFLSHKTQWRSFVHITIKVILSSRERLVLPQTFLKWSINGAVQSVRKPFVLCVIAEEAVCELWKWARPTECGKLFWVWGQLWGLCLSQRSLLRLEGQPLHVRDRVRTLASLNVLHLPKSKHPNNNRVPGIEAKDMKSVKCRIHFIDLIPVTFGKTIATCFNDLTTF